MAVTAEPEISLQYTLTRKDFWAGRRLGMMQGIASATLHILAWYIVPAFCSLAAVVCLIEVLSGSAQLVPPVLPIVLIPLIIPLAAWLEGSVAFNRLKIDAKTDPSMTFLADGTSFSREISKMGNITWLWSATHKIVANKRVVLVVARKGAFVILPRRIISDAQLARLKAMLLESRKPEGAAP